MQQEQDSRQKILKNVSKGKRDCNTAYT